MDTLLWIAIIVVAVASLTVMAFFVRTVIGGQLPPEWSLYFLGLSLALLGGSGLATEGDDVRWGWVFAALGLVTLAGTFSTYRVPLWRLPEFLAGRKAAVDDPLLGDNPYELIFSDRAAYTALIHEMRAVAEHTPAEDWERVLLVHLKTKGLGRPELARHLISLALHPSHDPRDGSAELRDRLRAAAEAEQPALSEEEREERHSRPVRTGRDRRDGAGYP